MNDDRQFSPFVHIECVQVFSLLSHFVFCQWTEFGAPKQRENLHEDKDEYAQYRRNDGGSAYYNEVVHEVVEPKRFALYAKAFWDFEGLGLMFHPGFREDSGRSSQILIKRYNLILTGCLDEP